MKKLYSLMIALVLVLASPMAVFAEEDTESPSSVEGLEVVEAGDSSITIKWEAATDDVAVAGYQVHFGTETVDEQGEVYENVEDVADVLEFTANDLENGTTYYFSVIAYDAVGNESLAWATEVSGTPAAEGQEEEDTDAPEVLSAEALNKEEVKVVFSEEVVLPEDAFEDFTIEADETLELLAVDDARYAKVDEEDPESEDDKTTVILTTLEQVADAAYTLTVNIGIEDNAGNPIVSGTADTAIFTGSAEEKPVEETSDGPSLVKAEAQDSEHVFVAFDRTVVLSTDPSTNFTISAESDPSVTLEILDVIMGQNENGDFHGAATIKTTPQTNQNYVIVVSDLKDEAEALINPDAASLVFTGFEAPVDEPDDSGDGVDDGGNDGSGDAGDGVDNVAPADVANFVARKIFEAQGFVVKLAWEIPAENIGVVEKQNIYKSTDGEGYAAEASVSPGITEYDVHGLENGSYWFKVTQEDAAGNESAGVIQKIILSETGPGLMGLVAFSLGAGHVVGRRKRK